MIVLKKPTQSAQRRSLGKMIWSKMISVRSVPIIILLIIILQKSHLYSFWLLMLNK